MPHSRPRLTPGAKERPRREAQRSSFKLKRSSAQVVECFSRRCPAALTNVLATLAQSPPSSTRLDHSQIPPFVSPAGPSSQGPGHDSPRSTLPSPQHAHISRRLCLQSRELSESTSGQLWVNSGSTTSLFPSSSISRHDHEVQFLMPTIPGFYSLLCQTDSRFRKSTHHIPHVPPSLVIPTPNE